MTEHTWRTETRCARCGTLDSFISEHMTCEQMEALKASCLPEGAAVPAAPATFEACSGFEQGPGNQCHRWLQALDRANPEGVIAQRCLKLREEHKAAGEAEEPCVFSRYSRVDPNDKREWCSVHEEFYPCIVPEPAPEPALITDHAFDAGSWSNPDWRYAAPERRKCLRCGADVSSHKAAPEEGR